MENYNEIWKQIDGYNNYYVSNFNQNPINIGNSAFLNNQRD